MTIAGLFAGIGGIELGFKEAGFTMSWANEIDKNASITYRHNHKHLLYEQDLRHLLASEVPAMDILTGGFPCQAFSIAGKQKGFKDDRGNVFFEILRFVDQHSPRIIFLENVKNLVSHDNGNTFARVKQELSQRGYFIKSQVLNSKDYGVPQNRERIYIVAFKNEHDFNRFSFPKPIPMTKKITDLLEDKVDEKYYYTHTKYYEQLKKEMVNPDTVYQWRRQYVRENKSNLCPTLTANMGTGGHNVPLVLDKYGIRKLTPRECARFQGYSDDFILPNLPNSALYKQIGNSVSVPVIAAIAKEIQKAIS